jgi:hypothetical protein
LEPRTVTAECWFADPVADIALLGPPEGEDFDDDQMAYQQLVESIAPLTLAIAPNNGVAWLWSSDEGWVACHIAHEDGPLWIFDAPDSIDRRMAGSPVLVDDGCAIGVLSSTSGIDGGSEHIIGPHPNLMRALPGWLIASTLRVSINQRLAG